MSVDRSKIEALLPDNNTREITPEDVRESIYLVDEISSNVAVSSSDTTADYLQEKLISSNSSILITKVNPGAAEQLDLQATLIGSGEANVGENLGLGAQAYAGMNGVNLTFRSLGDTATVTWTQGVDTLTAQVPANAFDAFGAASTVQGNLDSHTGDDTIHFTVGSISHTAITNVGTNTHVQIDNHIADSSIHGWLDGTTVTHWVDTLQTGAAATYAATNGQMIKVTLTGDGVINLTTPAIGAGESISFTVILIPGTFTPTWQVNGGAVTKSVPFPIWTDGTYYALSFFVDSAESMITGISEMT